VRVVAARVHLARVPALVVGVDLFLQGSRDSLLQQTQRKSSWCAALADQQPVQSEVWQHASSALAAACSN